MDKKTLKVIKIGGNVIDSEQELNLFLSHFSSIDSPKILVHGGGKLATELAEKMGIESQMVDGRRITGESTLDIITMVYGGLINKKIVAKLQSFNCLSIGVSGADANLISSNIRPKQPIDFGFVGDVKSVHSKTITDLLNIGLTPVFCAITHDSNGQLLNTNADTIASEIAKAMSQIMTVELIYCLDKAGVLTDINDNSSVIPSITKKNYHDLKLKGIIHSGMIPKLDTAFEALHSGVLSVTIGNISAIQPQVLSTKITL